MSLKIGVFINKIEYTPVGSIENMLTPPICATPQELSTVAYLFNQNSYQYDSKERRVIEHSKEFLTPKEIEKKVRIRTALDILEAYRRGCDYITLYGTFKIYFIR